MKKLNQLTFIKIKKFLQNRGYNISKKIKLYLKTLRAYITYL